MAKKIISVIVVILGGIGLGVLIKKYVDKKRKETDETIKENREANEVREALAENEEMNRRFGKKYVEIKASEE